MYRLAACITTQHDPHLLALAVLICCGSALTSLVLYDISTRSVGYGSSTWAGLAGVCAGTGIWSTHLIAVLAYRPRFPAIYEPVMMVESLLLAVGIAALGFCVASSRKRHAGLWGGAVVGLSIGALHFWGMLALTAPGTLHWDWEYLSASIVSGIALASVSLALFNVFRDGRAVFMSALALSLAVCGLHFTAMAGVHVVPDPAKDAFSALQESHLAVAVATVTFLVLICAWAAILVQRANFRFEAALREQNEIFESAIDHLPVAVSLFDADQRLIMCNPAYRQLYRLNGVESVLGRTFSDVVMQYVREQHDSPEGLRNAQAWIDTQLQKTSSGGVFTDTFELADGRTIRKRVGPISRGGWVDVQEDVTLAINANKQLAWAAKHDMLTGISNRAQFRRLLEEKFASCRPGSGFALHWIDLDHFKEINDKLGHQVGDQFLTGLAQSLAAGLRTEDFIGRLGGDEFAVLQSNVSDGDAALQFARRILAKLKGPYEVQGHHLEGAASIGVALAPKDGEAPDQLFASADIALYAAKGKGRGTVCLYETGLTHQDLESPLARELKEALTNGELLLHYQPIIDLKARRVCRFEALMRWKHPKRGMISPCDFIPIAEKTGAIVNMGAWAIQQACRDASQWPEDISVSVNLSPRQIEDGDIFGTVEQVLAATALAPSRLELEITETTVMSNPASVRRTLSRLHKVGVRLALDDFGTCFSNLSYLRQLPVGTIKIDRSFVEEVATPESRTILSAVADLAAKLGLRAVAEGIETEGALEAVIDAGYDEGQGFFFSLPVPVGAVSRTLARCQSRLDGLARRAA